MYKNLILSGGSVKGICAFVGAVRLMEEKNMLNDINTFIGASAGAIVSFMLCCGMKHAQMISFIKAQVARYQEVDLEVENILNVFYTMGFDDASFMMGCFKDVLTMTMGQSDITFMELAKMRGKNLVVCGSNLSTGKTDYFSVDTAPHMSVLQALRISTCLPFVFTPVIHNGHVYADAGLFSNFPVEYIDHDTVKTTLGICVEHKEQPPDVSKLNICSYVNLLINATFAKMNAKQREYDHKIWRIVFYENDPYSFNFNTMKFDITEAKLLSYEMYGYDHIKGARAAMAATGDGSAGGGAITAALASS